MTPDRAVDTCMQLVHSIARRFARPGVDYDDLVQEGTIGLLDAARLWREDGGANLASFAYLHVLGRVRQCAFRQARRGITHAAKNALDVVSFGAPFSEESDATLHDLLGESEEAELLEADSIVRLRAITDTLRDKDRAFIAARLAGQTHKEIGAAESLTRGAMWLREAGIVAKLRKRFARSGGAK